LETKIATSVPSKLVKMSLSTVVKGRIEQPSRLVLYGPPGIGKSTFASNSPMPIFVGAEKGTAQLDVTRFSQPEILDDVFSALTELGTQEHPYKTLVIDTADWLEPIIHKHVLDEDNRGKDASKASPDIDSMGFGRGYNLALTQWRKLITYFERLGDVKGMHVLILAHTQIKSFKNPEGEDYDRYEMKLHHKASGLLQEWADDVLFTNYETFTNEKKGRVRGISSGARIIHTTRTAAFDAKNRHNLPNELPLSWDDYADAIVKSEPASPESIKKAIDDILGTVDTEFATKVKESVKKADNNAVKLTQVLDRLRAVRKGQ
jgi:hypothetical protein